MSSTSPFRLGVIEGYFGRQWSWQCRKDYAGFLQRNGFTSYFYAPKNDRYLRKQWQQPYPDPELENLANLSELFRLHQVEFGIALSPFELYKDYSPANKEALRQKLQQINHLAPDTLCILFDDMMGDLHDLAAMQLQIIEFICAHSTASRLVLCPTYYSYDPLLSQHFGPSPEHYLDELGQQLDPAIDVFWTGPKVISNEYPVAHLQEVAQRLQRKPLLWDNYPVNDAKRLSTFLHLAPFANRHPEQLQTLCSGQMSNPMNQGYLSQIPLLSLAAVHQGKPLNLEQCLQQLVSPALGQCLLEDAICFQTQGLASFSPARTRDLIARYQAFPAEPMAQEVLEWLQGAYTFDPACLT